MRSSVAVVVPARDEEDGIEAALHAVCTSLDAARRAGLVAAATVEVAAHRCTDTTAVRARTLALARADVQVVADAGSRTVGEVRDRAVRRALSGLGTPPAVTWVLSTDADTVVGPTWVGDLLGAAAAARAVGVVGVTTLDRWRGSAPAAAAYEALLRSRSHDDPLHQHDHVYGANLAVRADAYLDVGGFPHHAHGEDQALVDALAARGHRLLRTRAVSVVTSGRLLGRAAGGLAAHLARLDETDEGVA